MAGSGNKKVVIEPCAKTREVQVVSDWPLMLSRISEKRGVAIGMIFDIPTMIA